MTQSKKPFILVLILFLFLVSIIFVYYIRIKPNYELNTLVINVVDGDTFDIASGERIRLICIDAPELSQPGGNESKSFLESLIMNKTLRLETDVSEEDSYGRLLRYAYLNDLFINKELVKQGHASIWKYEPDTRLCDEIAS
jgi:micrococcal nuclease